MCFLVVRRYSAEKQWEDDMYTRRCSVLAAVLSLGLCAGVTMGEGARADNLGVVSSPRGVTVNTLVLAPAATNRKATLILIPGGNGWLDIDTALAVPRQLAQ